MGSVGDSTSVGSPPATQIRFVTSLHIISTEINLKSWEKVMKHSSILEATSNPTIDPFFKNGIGTDE